MEFFLHTICVILECNVLRLPIQRLRNERTFVLHLGKGELIEQFSFSFTIATSALEMKY